MQELIDIIKQRINDDDSIPYMYNERILELAESLLEKEKEVMCEFAIKYAMADRKEPCETSTQLVFDETFNTKEK